MDVIRALVAADNSAMQELCRARGFKRQFAEQALFVLKSPSAATCTDGYRGQGSAGTKRHDAHLIRVETLTYSGIWLEGKLSQEAIAAARKRAAPNDMTRMGAVIPQADESAAELLRANGFKRVGEFDWWTLSPGNGLS